VLYKGVAGNVLEDEVQSRKCAGVDYGCCVLKVRRWCCSWVGSKKESRCTAMVPKSDGRHGKDGKRRPVDGNLVDSATCPLRLHSDEDRVTKYVEPLLQVSSHCSR
jgi:hypothetical protein